MAGIKMSDKPPIVRYGYSVSLDKFKRFGRNGTEPRLEATGQLEGKQLKDSLARPQVEQGRTNGG
jgi:hypothetical protein